MVEKILSICIPTYNRGDILDKTLSELVQETSFLSGKIEICISDNASSDNTKNVVQKYLDKYDNILYNRNDQNTVVIDGNFPIVASLASGVFIKFLNDYACFIPGELDKMIQFIESNAHDKPVLFFSNNSILNNTNELIYCDSLNEFVKNASYWTTWVLAAGFWRDDFLTLKERDRFIEKFMWCPDNYLKLISSGRRAIIYNNKFCYFHDLKSKGGYNVFYTFGISYLFLYNEYIDSGVLDIKVYRAEKYKLFRYYIMRWYYTLIISDNTIYSFDKSNAFKYLLKNYRLNLYLYFGILYLYIKYFMINYLKINVGLLKKNN